MLRRVSVLAEDEGKRALERAWLIYTPAWGGAAAIVMLTGLAERWGDVELMAFGVVAMLGTFVAAWLSMPPSERARPIFERTAVKQALAVTALSFGLNYFQTPFFFDVLHMRYGFRATWVIERNPVFLYFLTVSYFATYSVLACIAMRGLARLSASWPWRALSVLLVACALAFLETLANANPFMTRLFCYGEPAMMYSFGTLAYGISLALAIPGWLWLDESKGARLSVLAAVGCTVLAVALDTAVVAGLRAWVAPSVTTVEEPGAPGWDERGCLEAP